MAVKRTRSKLPSLFRPNFVQLEDRAVPAALFVDNAFTGLSNGATATFNAGQSNQQAGVIIGTNGFATIDAAIAKAEADAASDVVNLANGNFNVDPTAHAGPFLITHPLSLVGSGKAVSTVKATSDTVALSGTNGGVFVAQNTTFNVSGITFEGNTAGGVDIGTALRFETSSGTVLGSTFQNVTNSGVLGLAILATGSGSVVTVDTNSFSGNGIGNVRFDAGATGTVKASTFVGRNTAGAVNYGVEASNGAVGVLITGNTFSNFGKIGDGATITPSSAAVSVYDNSGSTPSSATILGNTFSTNDTAIFIGNSSANDDSFATINFNNFPTSNSYTVFVQATTTSNATNNFWGNTTGPNNDPTTGNISNTGVTFSDPAITQPPNGIIQSTLPVTVATSPADFLNQVAPTLTVTGPPINTSSPITLTFTFSTPVTGFTASDIKLSGAVGTPVLGTITDLGGGKFSVPVSGLNKRGTLTVDVAAGSVTDAAGLGNQVSTNAVAFKPPFDDGFGVSGDSGIVTPTYGVTEALATRFGTSVFGSSFTGGVRTATADVNGDGTLDYIVASGPGRQTEVRVIDGATEATLFTVIPFGSTFTKGGYVSAGDLTGDGLADIVITAERGGGARVRIFRGATNPAGFTQLSDFIGIIGSNGVADTGFRGGARSAVGDINGDGRADLVFAAGTGGGPRIAIFNGIGLGSNGGPKLTGDFFVFEPTLRDGSNVAVGDVDGDGKADLIAGAGNGASRVRVINGNTLITSNGATVTAIADYFAFGTQGRTGVRVAARDLDLDGKADVIAGPGSGAGSSVRLYSAVNLLANPGSPAISNTVSLFGSFTGGVFVG